MKIQFQMNCLLYLMQLTNYPKMRIQIQIILLISELNKSFKDDKFRAYVNIEDCELDIIDSEKENDILFFLNKYYNQNINYKNSCKNNLCRITIIIFDISKIRIPTPVHYYNLISSDLNEYTSIKVTTSIPKCDENSSAFPHSKIAFNVSGIYQLEIIRIAKCYFDQDEDLTANTASNHIKSVFHEHYWSDQTCDGILPIKLNKKSREPNYT